MCQEEKSKQVDMIYDFSSSSQGQLYHCHHPIVLMFVLLTKDGRCIMVIPVVKATRVLVDATTPQHILVLQDENCTSNGEPKIIDNGSWYKLIQGKNMSTMNENNLLGKPLQGTLQQCQQQQQQQPPPPQQPQQQQQQQQQQHMQRSFFLYPPPAAPEYDGFSSYLMENLLSHRQHQQKFVYSSPPGINADAINFQHDPSYKLPTPPNFTGMYFEQKRLVRTKRKKPSKPPPPTNATKKHRLSSSASFIRRNPQSTLNLIRKSNEQEKEKEIKTIKSYNHTHDSPAGGGEKEDDEEDDVPDSPHCKVWTDNYLLLKEYRKQHGHCNVPQRKEGQLGPWVKRQRGEYKRHKMRKNRVALLNELGFVWNMKKDEHERKERERGTFDPTAAAADNNNAKWLAQYKMLVKYRKRHKHCNVPQKDGQLGKWVNFQRHVYARNKMKEDRKKLLNKIGFVWKLR